MRLQAFAGDWQVERDIEDAHAGRHGRFTGRASFTPSPDGLRYREEGRLALDGAPAMAATRDYLWRDGGAGTIEVLFADGRPFHRFLPDEPDPAAEHACPPDTYRVRYDFRQWPRWRAEWRVTGPRKDLRLVSRFRRAGR
jgi:Family of unknown function (DUF6314)